MVEVQCDCGRAFKVPESRIGQRGRCPKCGAVIEVTAPETWVSSYGVSEAEAISRQQDAERQQVDLACGMPSIHDFAWIIFLAALIPLAIYTLLPADHPGKRLESTISHASPTAQQKLDEFRGKADLDGPLPDWVVQHLSEPFFALLPDHRIDGALLARDSFAHWLMAGWSVGVFLMVIAYVFHRGDIPAGRVFKIGLFTATAGILLLLALQVLAVFASGLLIGGVGIIALIMWVLKFIGCAYRLAFDPEAGFLISAIGFTCSVGLLEEGVKAIPFIRRAADSSPVGWRSLCVLGLASGAGFGISEGIIYCSDFYNGVMGGGVYYVRFISCVALHAVWSGSAGITAFQNRSRFVDADGIGALIIAVLRSIAVVVVLHGLYDTLLKKEYNFPALLLAAGSVVLLAYQIQTMRQREAAAAARNAQAPVTPEPISAQ